ncbi:hypothetical protein SAMN04489712_101489 [Thermomonospora echinospora]|uniref:Uncharacterized protein n=1 Tax=Thermomonospora echinospora TaxID=1992 RepID=A0A1H5T5C7_9ACTN|nr:hypothetical protein [Thermomonospora echinospora]SEF57964.1 hypothetical protein SAMN04489712_101489 [Thermomonospora echinospora]
MGAQRDDDPDRPESTPGPSFDIPAGGSHGPARALESLSGIAAPLLAAAAVTVIGVIVQQPSSLAWPSLALTLLVLSAIALIAAVQLGFWARAHVVTPAELAEWWPMLKPEDRWRRVRETQWRAAAHYRRWDDATRYAYSAGIVLLWLGIGVALVPDDPSVYRWVPAVLAWLAALAEIIWSLAALMSPNGRCRVLGLRRLAEWVRRPHYVDPPPEVWPYAPDRDPFKP